MNTMADGAAQRLVAQISEALFGQPGLTLMELAEKVKASRSLLSDADVLEVVARYVGKTSAAYRYIAEDLATRHAANMDDAQPSPAGQGDARAQYEAWYASLPQRLVDDCDEPYTMPVGGSPWDAWQAALAARQPVGQPVAWMTRHDEPMLYPTFSEAAAYCDDDEPPIPLYAVPPAQAVDDDWHLHGYAYASKQATTCAGCGEHKHTPLRIDAMGGYFCLTCIDQKLSAMLGEFGYQPVQAVDLGRFRPMVVEYKRSYDGVDHAEEMRECDDLLALIDSQAVPNG